MKLSTKSKYAIVALLDIIEFGVDKIISLNEISNRQNLPLSYLEQIFLKLRRNGIIDSVRGSNGGYLFAKSPAHITLYQIVMAVDDLNITHPCQGIGSGCSPSGARCLTHQLFSSIDIVLMDFLHKITLHDVMEKTLYQKTVRDRTECNSADHIHQKGKVSDCVYHTA